MIELDLPISQGNISISCPEPACSSHQSGPGSSRIGRNGFYQRKSDRRKIPRFKCKDCKRNFSTATFDFCFGQKKRHLNQEVFRRLYSGTSQRRLVIELRINLKTAARKLVFLAKYARILHAQWLKELHEGGVRLENVQFDEMETFEHSKCKPLSVPLLVMSGTRKILSFGVCSMPAKGPLAGISFKKYGYRIDARTETLEQLLESAAHVLSPEVNIRSDMNPRYPGVVSKVLSRATHETFKSRKATVAGLGEMKKGGRDPLFWLNHTCAMFRANVNRLFRRTWNTTKNPARLNDHMALYMIYHNWILTSPLKA